MTNIEFVKRGHANLKHLESFSVVENPQSTLIGNCRFIHIHGAEEREFMHLATRD